MLAPMSDTMCSLSSEFLFAAQELPSVTARRSSSASATAKVSLAELELEGACWWNHGPAAVWTSLQESSRYTISRLAWCRGEELGQCT